MKTFILIYGIIVSMPTVAFAVLDLNPKTFPESLENIFIGQTIDFQAQASGGTFPYTYAVCFGALPPSLTMDPQTGRIYGTAQIADTYTFSILVEDAEGSKQSFSGFTLSIMSPLAFNMDTIFLYGTVNRLFSESLKINGGKKPYSLSIRGDPLPSDLSLSANHAGKIEGTPQTAGVSHVTIHVRDVIGNTQETTLSITIFEPVTLLTQQLNDGYVGQLYEMKLMANGGSGSYTFFSSRLPDGLWVHQHRQMITGIPEQKTSSGPVTIEIKDKLGNSVQKTLSSFDISDPLIVSNLPDGKIGEVYSHHLPISGGKGPVNCTVYGDLSNITFFPDTCLFEGIPSVANYYNLEISVSDNAYPIPQTFHTFMNVIIYDRMFIENDPVFPTAIQGQEILPIKLNIIGTASKTHCQVTQGELPGGIYLDTSDMTLQGTPLQSGTYLFEITISDTLDQAHKQFYWHIREAMTFNTQKLPEMVYQQPYSFGLDISGGTSPIYCNIIDDLLPEGILFNRQHCQFSGVVESHQNAFSLTIDAFDSGSPQQRKEHTFRIETSNPEQLSILPKNLSPVLAYRSYKQSFMSTNERINKQWDIVSADVPGLHFDTSDFSLILKGIPDQPGIYRFQIKLMDVNGNVLPACQEYTLAVMPPLTIDTKSLDYARRGKFYHDLIAIQGGSPPYQFEITGGALPDGVQLNEDTGGLSGTPTAEESTLFTVCVAGSGYFKQRICRSFPMIVFSGTELDIQVSEPVCARQFEPLTLIFSGMGGARPYGWTDESSMLPAGLFSSIQNEQLIISGEPEICDPSQPFLIRTRLIDQRKYVTSRAFGLNITCACAYELSGNVSNLPGIRLSLYRKGEPTEQPIQETLTNDVGNYRFTVSDCDAYYVKPASPNFIFTPEQSPVISRENRSALNFDAQFIHDTPPEMFQAKALMIFGASDHRDIINAIQEKVLSTLTANGFNEKNHRWIDAQTPEPLKCIKTAITEWASNACMLWLYLCGTFNEDTFDIDGQNHLPVQELSGWLNAFGRHSGKKIVIIAEGFPSADIYLSHLDVFSHVSTIRISAPFPESTPDNFWTYFSSIFWQNLSNDTLANAYIYAQLHRENAAQFMLDATADGLVDQRDLEIAETIHLNGTVIDLPQIDQHSPSQTLDSDNNAHLWVSVKPGTYRVDRVFAREFSVPLPENYPYLISDGDQIELVFNEDSGLYEADKRFDEQGAYHIVFWAADINGFYSNPKPIKIDRKEIYKAVIISGRRSLGEQDILQDAVQLNADFAHDALEQLGFSPKDIVYLSANETFKPFRKLESADMLGTVLNQMADESDRMLIYMIDHGEKNTFYLNNEQSVSTSTFNEWLQDMAPKIPHGLVLIYDACYSGEFINQLTHDNSHRFVRISSTSPEENAVFYNDGTLSFSFHFWANLFTGKFNLVESFENARRFLKKSNGVDQNPQIDLNGDNRWNQADDLPLGFCDFPISKHERSLNIKEWTTIVQPQNAVLDISCKLQDAILQDIEDVFAVVYPPMTARSARVSPKLLMQKKDTLFHAFYTDALAPGDYEIHYFANYTDGYQKFFDSQTITQDVQIKKDCFEPDDDLPLSIPLDHYLQRSFHEPSDKDIMYFYAQANQTYTISIFRTRTSPDVLFELSFYTKDISSRWFSAPQTQSSQEWDCQQSGLYYLTAMLATGETGITTGENYQIMLTFPEKTDAYEQDDRQGTARPIDINGRSPQYHTFHNETDTDWVKFFGIKDVTYTVKCFPDLYNQRLSINLFNDTMTPVSEYRKRIKSRFQGRDVTCPKTGIYYINILPDVNTWNDAVLFAYTLSVSIMEGPNLGGGYIQGRVEDRFDANVPLSDVGLFINGEKTSTLVIHGNYSIYCGNKTGPIDLIAQKGEYLNYIEQIDCPAFPEVKHHDIVMNHKLKSIIAILQLQAGITPEILPKGIRLDKNLNLNEVLLILR
ncbi:MAG: putative Ig domain-containing protein [Candidatus Magnetomorum sp.]|nr:putative Ig domain-containing protein [Candidatus Magnetomorum sp.]